MVSSSKVIACEFISKSTYWKEHIGSRRNSGMNRREYCHKNNLSAHKLEYQERKLANKLSNNKKTILLPIKLTHDNISKYEPRITLCTLALKNGNELKIHDKSILATLLSILS